MIVGKNLHFVSVDMNPAMTANSVYNQNGTLEADWSFAVKSGKWFAIWKRDGDKICLTGKQEGTRQCRTWRQAGDGRAEVNRELCMELIASCSRNRSCQPIRTQTCDAGLSQLS